ncbi:unnamed protein product [Ectocarpus sp. CCAP 1310/34]|nr:unnamed protein product [Ectocarpus sp. CCAP 1310/34]
MEVDQKNVVRGDRDGDAEDLRRVRVSLSRRGCKWADDVVLKDRDQASGLGSDAGLGVYFKASWTVRELATKAEELLLEKQGLALATALVLCPSRDSAIPFYDVASHYVGEGDTLVLVGDVERAVARRSAPPGGQPAAAAAAAAAAVSSATSSHKVPVTILTGFLGSGKTTMLNHLLHVQREKRIAVIENEFGEVPIDGDLLADGDGLSAAEQVVVLDNGCMCCTVRGDLLGAFSSVLAKMEEAKAGAEGGGGGSGRALDSVLVETTGMADPVPIVRTLLQTPAISNSFALEGVVTLVDAKNILPRLQEGEGEEGGGKGEEEIDEAFQQIMFSDRIVVNKVDLVPASTAVEVFQRIRSMNGTAGVVSCSRGKLDPRELEGLGAFDRLMRRAEEEPEMDPEPHSHDHAHSHSHAHEHEHNHGDSACGGEEGGCSLQGPQPCAVDHDHGGHADGTLDGEGCNLEHDHTGHSHDTRHSSQVGTFSLVKKSTEVLALPFARWVRSLAFLPREKGLLFRSKAVLAVAGSNRKLVFHAVSDVMETREAGRWGDGEDRGCRIVFIGKRLDRAFLEEGFNSTARAVAPKRGTMRLPSSPAAVAATLRGGGGAPPPPSDDSATSVATGESILEGLAARVTVGFFSAMLWLGTGEVLRVGEACSGLLAAVEGGHAAEHYRSLLAEEEKEGSSAQPGFHLSLRRSSPKFYLLPLVSAATARSYAKAAAAAKLEMTPSMGQGRTGISFKNAQEVEAAGITWLEVEQLADPLAKNFVVEFSWRPETMRTFFESGNSSTSSAMVKIEYEANEDAFDDEVDTLKFRLVLRPETVENNEASVDAASPVPRTAAAEIPAASSGSASALPLHRLMIQTVGGRSCSQVYGLSFHSISPSFQVHVQVPDHRVPYFQTDQLFHKWHPLMESLRAEPRLRFLVRMKPDGSGPLDNMCGCC